MEFEFCDAPLIDELKQRLLLINQDSEVSSILILAADGNNYDPVLIDPILRAIEKPLFGGIFPGLIFQQKKFEKGFIIIKFKLHTDVELIENISLPATDFNDQLLNLSDRLTTNTKSLFVFIDGFSKRTNHFIDSIFMTMGLEYNYIGGGCGSLSLEQKPCIFSNKGLLQDSAIIAAFDLESGIGVSHGWSSLAGPFKVTASEGTCVKELDYKPAFEVYKSVLNREKSTGITPDNFFSIAKSFPFGIHKLDAEKVIRDPIAVGLNNSLLCVGEVEVGSFLHIMNGNKEDLIKAARNATIMAIANKGEPPKNLLFLVDCVSRVLFLEDDFYLELEEVSSECNHLPLLGVLSIGEIADNKKDYLEFHNKTSVVGCF
ncbi:FIST signal transduction protein [Alkaliflexus imshenetskii]|uniref:FIST signal transduction protein n=1 Tax=Alkaliflexus imshenetskii TaxID=286730 RepID=UPI0004BA2952|nr:FIST C-terminal domain-containing protein [Alkaliflexus imshenetskii]